MGLFNHSDNNDNSNSPAPNLLSGQQLTITGLSGNELYCTALCGYTPGNILVGNSVYSLGALGNLTANLHTGFGGEIPQYTNMISEGRRLALEHFEQEMQQSGAAGATGLTNDIVFHSGNIEFLSVGTSVYRGSDASANGVMTSSTNGQELFCQMDAGFLPMRLAFGNVAYSIGIGGNLLGSLHQMGHGEISEYSNVFATTRNAALQRICEHATQFNANCVTGIRTTVLPIGDKGIQEMIMVGTASYHPAITEIAGHLGGPVTSGLTAQELWSVIKMGLMPVRLVIGTSVYSLGVLGGIKAALEGVTKGEMNSLTEMVYGAREQSLKKIQDQAAAVEADMVIGVKTYIYQLSNNLVEFFAIGTAVKRVPDLATHSDQLPPQAVINDVDTFIDRTQQTIHLGSHDHPDEPASSTPEQSTANV
jgi:uncharacterized protein YbjQ (UPF0145 family)